MNIKASLLIKELIKMGVMALNGPIDQDSAQLVVEELGHTRCWSVVMPLKKSL